MESLSKSEKAQILEGESLLSPRLGMLLCAFLLERISSSSFPLYSRISTKSSTPSELFKAITLWRDGFFNGPPGFASSIQKEDYSLELASEELFIEWLSVNQSYQQILSSGKFVDRAILKTRDEHVLGKASQKKSFPANLSFYESDNPFLELEAALLKLSEFQKSYLLIPATGENIEVLKALSRKLGITLDLPRIASSDMDFIKWVCSTGDLIKSNFQRKDVIGWFWRLRRLGGTKRGLPPRELNALDEYLRVYGFEGGSDRLADLIRRRSQKSSVPYPAYSSFLMLLEGSVNGKPGKYYDILLKLLQKENLLSAWIGDQTAFSRKNTATYKKFITFLLDELPVFKSLVFGDDEDSFTRAAIQIYYESLEVEKDFESSFLLFEQTTQNEKTRISQKNIGKIFEGSDFQEPLWIASLEASEFIRSECTYFFPLKWRSKLSEMGDFKSKNSLVSFLGDVFFERFKFSNEIYFSGTSNLKEGIQEFVNSEIEPVVMNTPSSDEGKENQLYFNSRLSSALRDSPESHESHDLSDSADLKDGQLNLSKPKTVSVTALGTFLQCPYRYFNTFLMKTEEVICPSAELFPLERGRLFHDTMETYFRNLSSLEYDPEKFETAFNQALEKTFWKGVYSKKDFRDKNILRFKSSVSELLHSELVRLRSSEARWLKSFLEIKIKEKLIGDTPITARVDRVDIFESHGELIFDVVEYKLSAASVPTKPDFEKGYFPQLPIYQKVLEERLLEILPEFTEVLGFSEPITKDNLHPGSTYYLSLKEGKLISFDAKGALDECLSGLDSFLKSFESADFNAQPYKKQFCDLCPVNSFCYKFNETSQGVNS